MLNICIFFQPCEPLGHHDGQAGNVGPSPGGGGRSVDLPAGGREEEVDTLVHHVAMVRWWVEQKQLEEDIHSLSSSTRGIFPFFFF